MARSKDRYKDRQCKGGTQGLIDPPPRIVSFAQERREQKIRDELSGETDKQRRSKVTLPHFKFMDKPFEQDL